MSQLKEVIGPSLPRLVTTTLLPFRGKIIYDGLVFGYSITFGSGIKRSLNEEYKQAKEAFGTIISLEDDTASTAKTEKKPKQQELNSWQTRTKLGGSDWLPWG